ncbi:YobA family protein [Indiicoccus explosivorum]|uniref:YobA family protein n=1 Tax=Indiicoccus explosivorum TaxID=1917864 RepID=UPI000B438D2F|nr:YobA family protein [Indiicoccus explosivorum]
MRKVYVIAGAVFFLAACGTGEEQPAAVDEPVSSSEFDTVDRREIIASLEPAADPGSVDLQSGADTAFKAVRDVYGEFHETGVFFIEHNKTGSGEPGIWIGIKEPDERVDELVSVLQEQVDAGRLMADDVHIFDSDFTEAELEAATNRVAETLRGMAEAHHSPSKVGLSIFSDVKSGTVIVSHNFLTEEQQAEVESLLENFEVEVEQSGMMVPEPGEPTVVYPDPAVTAEPSDEGDYLVDVQDGRFLAVDATAQDFSENGGQEEFYSAIYFDFPNAAEQLEVGQRVKVEASGPIMESYPGQGTAVFVEVLPAYQPEGADLTEFDAVREALTMTEKESAPIEVPAVQSVTYSAEQDAWTVVLQLGDQEIEKTITDE